MDLYGYCTDDPVNFMDRSGLAGGSEAGEDGEDEEDEEDEESMVGFLFIHQKTQILMVAMGFIFMAGS